MSTDPDGPTPQMLCRVIGGAESVAPTTISAQRPLDLPGDDAVLIARAVGAAVSTVGFGVALAGRFLSLPRLSGAAAAAVVTVDHQPRLRRIVDTPVGPDAAGLLFAAVNTLTLSPDSLAVEAAMRGALLAEAWSGRRAWQRREPTLPGAVDGLPRAGWRPDRTAGPLYQRHLVISA
ncbi:cation-translocating P-type ATPase, partial [Rhodococcus opacus]|nr:cation-translocating P-type ATPase [Rhodococcus opacus]